MRQTHLYIYFYGSGEGFNTAVSDFTSSLTREFVGWRHIADLHGYPYLAEHGNKTACENVVAITSHIITSNIILIIFSSNWGYL